MRQSPAVHTMLGRGSGEGAQWLPCCAACLTEILSKRTRGTSFSRGRWSESHATCTARRIELLPQMWPNRVAQDERKSYLTSDGSHEGSVLQVLRQWSQPQSMRTAMGCLLAE